MAGVQYKVMQCMYVTCGVTTQFLWILMECLSISVFALLELLYA